MKSVRVVYILSEDAQKAGLLVNLLAMIFPHFQFIHSCSILSLRSLSNEIVVLDRSTLDSQILKYLKPNEMGGDWLIVNGLSDDESNVLGLISLGFSGLISASDTLECLPKALRSIESGQLWFSREVMSQALRQLVHVGGISDQSVNVVCAKYGLSRREHEVLFYLLKGNSNKSIATILSVSLSTVKTHVSNILVKTERQNRNQLSSLLLDEIAA